MEKQLLGSEAPLQKNSPLTNLPEAKTGTPQEEFFGSQAPISRTPYSNTPYNQGTGEPTKQFFGSEAPLNHTPVHGWESFTTPMSHRAMEQSGKKTK
jgi:hypothetical protein